MDWGLALFAVVGVMWNLDLAFAEGLRDMGDTAGPDRHTLDRGRDGGNCVAGSKQALALLLPSRYCCLTIAASSMGSWLLSPLRSRDLPTMKGHRPSASADLSVRANL
jgi:hypothetical protein